MDNYTPTRHFYIKVDLESADKIVTDSGFELYAPREEGDTYQSMPFHGELVNAPKFSHIPIGETVYLDFKAIDTLHKEGGDAYYIVEDNLIVAYGDIKNLKAYKSIIVDPENKKIESDYLHLPDFLFHGQVTTSGTVITADNDWLGMDETDCDAKLYAGDKIEYSKNLDWEFFVNRKRHYYIKWPDRIFKVNGKLINDYTELAEKEEYIERNGIRVPNNSPYYRAIGGKFAGCEILPEKPRIESEKYIRNRFIQGHVIEIE